MKKICALLIFVIILCSVFAACDSKDNERFESTSSNDVTDMSDASAPDDAENASNAGDPEDNILSNLPLEMPSDFAIKFSIKYLAEEIYDTYTGTIQKDLIENGTASASFVPSEETLKEIYAKVLEYQICAIDRKMTNDEIADKDGLQYGVSPNSNYEITITANGNTYLICGDDTAQGYTNTETDAKNFMDFVIFMRKTLHDNPEYQNLPDAVGGYE